MNSQNPPNNNEFSLSTSGYVQDAGHDQDGHIFIQLKVCFCNFFTCCSAKNFKFDKRQLAYLFVGMKIFILIFILVLIRANKRDVRWNIAFSYGLVLAILFALNALNQFPITLTWVDSSQSLITLLFSKVIWDIILLSLMRGLILGVMIAGAEVFYRDQYPDQVAFRNIFSAAGLKTKYFFKSVILGLTLTAIFFGYQT